MQRLRYDITVFLKLFFAYNNNNVCIYICFNAEFWNCIIFIINIIIFQDNNIQKAKFWNCSLPIIYCTLLNNRKVHEYLHIKSQFWTRHFTLSISIFTLIVSIETTLEHLIWQYRFYTNHPWYTIRGTLSPNYNTTTTADWNLSERIEDR